MNDLSPAEYRALLRQDLPTFLQRSFHTLNPQAPFLSNWHITLICSRLQDCLDGRIRRLIINVPPRSLKSICVSVALPAFWLARDPTARMLCVSYGQDLANKHARDCRTVMTSAWYKSMCSTRLSPKRQAVDEFTTTREGYRIATSMGGVVTGFGAGILIIDDPMKPDEAFSDVQRRAANEYYDHTLYSRLDSKVSGCIIIIMQRLHLDDLVGHVLGQEHWDILSLPAIAETDEEFHAKTLFGPRRFIRRPGDVLHPEREPQEALDRIREAIGPYNWAGQYQQSPVPLGGGLVKAEWFRTYEPHQLPEKFDRIIQSWDTANKPTELSDYSVCTTWGAKDKNVYLRNVFRKRVNYPDLKRAVREQQEAFGADVVLIEDKASGTQLIQELVVEGMLQVTKYEPAMEKIMRLHAQTGMIENGFVHLPKEAHWLADYLLEVTSFPKGKYDDQVDSTAQALDWFKSGAWFPGWGILEYYRQQTEKLSADEADLKKLIRVRPPHAVSHVYTLSGQSIMAGADGIFELSKKDAHPLIVAGWVRVEDANSD